ncbi:hypothetical protein J132_09636 [Termitomyces sp. J132]|nr:hypothetical protein J132_09636 [Termitomyces sp. J132]
MDDLTAGMTVSASAVTSASDPAKHLVGALAVARGEGRSEGRRNEEAANRGDIQEAGPSTPKAATGGVARGLATSPKLATTPKSKGKGKGKAKAQDEEDEDIEDHVEETFTDKRLVTLLRCATTAGQITTQKAAGTPRGSSLAIVATALGRAARTVALRSARAFVERQRELARRGEPIKVKHLSLTLPTLQEEGLVGGSGGTRVKSREMVESDDNDNDNGTNEEGREDAEMRETTPLATVAEVEASDMEIEGEEEVEAVPVATEEEERAEEVEVVRRGTWSATPLRPVGDDELEWLGEDLGWPTPLTRTLATLAGYQRDCQAFLAWQEENNISKEDWEEMEAMEVPDNDADLDA